MSEGKLTLGNVWDNAPAKATHFSPKPDASGIWCDVYWRFEGDVPREAWRVEDDGKQTNIKNPSISVECMNRLIERPAPISWIGTGLPTVGVECEYQHVNWGSEWKRGEVLFLSNEYLISRERGNEQHYYPREMIFRPIRTPEQIAAEEREKAIEQMKLDAGWRVKGSCVFTFLYDAGYRKAKEEA